jgi:hypothetical protein
MRSAAWAVLLIASTSSTSSSTVDELIQRAAQRLAMGDRPGAVDLFESALKTLPADSPGLAAVHFNIALLSSEASRSVAAFGIGLLLQPTESSMCATDRSSADLIGGQPPAYLAAGRGRSRWCFLWRQVPEVSGAARAEGCSTRGHRRLCPHSTAAGRSGAIPMPPRMHGRRATRRMQHTSTLQ